MASPISFHKKPFKALLNERVDQGTPLKPPDIEQRLLTVAHQAYQALIDHQAKKRQKSPQEDHHHLHNTQTHPFLYS
jgi:hypothetical protein